MTNNTNENGGLRRFLRKRMQNALAPAALFILYVFFGIFGRNYFSYPTLVNITDAAQAILNRVQSDNILGIFCSNEGAARGILSASNDGSAIPDQYPGLLVVGFDAGKTQKAAVKAGYFMGAITQDPVQIGFKAVELAVFAIQKKPVKDVDTGAKFYDASTMDQPEFGPLLYD